jgi:hypothetical protein
MTTKTGTPKTLEQAIRNALLDASTNGGWRYTANGEQADLALTIQAHVIDFLAQRAGTFILQLDSVEAELFMNTFWNKVKNSGK